MYLKKIMNLLVWSMIMVMIVIGFVACYRKEKQQQTAIAPLPLPENLPPAMTYEKVIQHYTTTN